MKPLLLALALVSAFPARAETKVEFGELEGASYRIDVPDNWNGGLVIYCHGYSSNPVKLGPKKLYPGLAPFIEQGFAIAQSGFSGGAWSIDESVKDTELLRKHFAAKNGTPKKTFLTGESLGGFLTMVIIEKNPDAYDGALALCAPLISADWFMARRVFDLRVVFDHYFPSVFPTPDTLPLAAAVKLPAIPEVEAKLNANESAAANLRLYSGIHTNKELAFMVSFFSLMLNDLARKAGGNAFDNTNVIYAGTNDDNELNAGIVRYRSNKLAANYVRAIYRPTGRLKRPLVSLETTYDPLMPAWVVNRYVSLVEETGSESLFSQKYVAGSGHCAFPPAEVGRAFTQLREWAEKGEQPDTAARRTAADIH